MVFEAVILTVLQNMQVPGNITSTAVRVYVLDWPVAFPG